MKDGKQYDKNIVKQELDLDDEDNNDLSDYGVGREWDEEFDEDKDTEVTDPTTEDLDDEEDPLQRMT